jgi:hypothetical protein
MKGLILRARNSLGSAHIFSCIPTPGGPFDKASIFFETVDVHNPLCAGGTRYYHYIRNVTVSHAA